MKVRRKSAKSKRVIQKQHRQKRQRPAIVTETLEDDDPNAGHNTVFAIPAPPRVRTSQIAGSSTAGPVIIQPPDLNSVEQTNRHSSGNIRVDFPVNDIENYAQIGVKFDEKISKLQINSCNNCQRSFTSLTLNKDGNCTSCAPYRISKMSTEVKNMYLMKYTGANNMDPGDVPLQLQGLTYIEEMLIARVHPVICLFRINGGQFGYSGNVINFYQDVSQLFRKMPVLPSTSQATVLLTRTTPHGVSYFRVRAQKVRDALLWLKNHNQYYHDIEIDEQILSTLPDDGDITEILTRISIDSDNDQPYVSELQQNELTESYYPSIPQCNQEERIQAEANQGLSWPHQQPDPISEFKTEGYIAMAFPTLFPYGYADFLTPREVSVSMIDYFKYMLQYKDGRFAKHPRFRFLAANTLMRLQALSQGDIYARKSALKDLTREEFFSKVENDPNFADNVMFYASKLRTSRSYWHQRCGELLDMVNQLGTPHIFFTLSAADYHWPDLFRLLTTQPVDQLTEKQRADLMHENPLITAHFFTKRAEIFVNDVIKKLFNVKDFWFRYEWQWRGSPHLHGLLWIENAPDISNLDNLDEVSIQNLAQYCQNICTAMNPNVNLPPSEDHPCRKNFTNSLAEENDLPFLLNRVQRHTKCGDHCYRKKRGTATVKCRFNFPQPLKDNGELIKENNIWTYHPQRNDELLQRYNPAITRIWRGNTDFTPIVSKQAVLNYIAKYASKSEQSSKSYATILRDIATTEADSDPKKIVKKLMLTSTAERDYSAQEIAHYLMGWPLFRASRSFVTVSIKDEVWVNMAPAHTTVDNSIFGRYKHREQELSGVSLFNVAKDYSLEKGHFVFKGKDSIVRIFPRYKHLGVPNEDENFFKMWAILHIPWTHDYNILIAGLEDQPFPWTELCRSQERMSEYFLDFPVDDDEFLDEEVQNPLRVQDEQYMAVSRVCPNLQNTHPVGKRHIDIAFEWENSNLTENEVKSIQSWLKTQKENYASRQNFASQRTISFSPDQQRVINLFQNQLSQLSAGEVPEIKRVMVQGKAGCGKSYVINYMKTLAYQVLGPDSIEILAPTGVAANNINGKTLHSLLKIRPDSYVPLQSEGQRNFQNFMQKRKIIIFDEMSMIGLNLVYKIDQRLKEGSGISDEPFGGFIIYFFGDMRQLPPVKDTAMYQPKPNNASASSGKMVIDSFQSNFLLSTCHRQSDEDQINFRNLLDAVAKTNVTTDMWKSLLERRQAVLEPHEVQRFKNSIRLYATRDKVKDYNVMCLEKSGSPVAFFPANNNSYVAKEAPDDISQQLPEELYLTYGCRVMLKTNLWTDTGLVNGAIGTVRKIYFTNNRRPPNLPVCIMIEFDKYTGPCYEENLVPITPITRTWQKDGIDCSKTQLPVNLAHAITVHKAQGITLDQAVIDLSSGERQTGLTYVALSRVKRIEGLMIETCADFQSFLGTRNLNVVHNREEFLKKFS